MSIVIKEKEFDINKVQEGKYEQWGITFKLDCIYEVFNEFETNNLRGINLSVTKAGEYFLEGWKGPEEKCLDGGRTVDYKGNCLAVLDDDNHFIFKNMRICEKTTSVYMLPVYQNELEVSEPDPELYARLTNDPVLFDCDTFDRDAGLVAESIKYSPETAEVSLLYTGPFRCIFLPNGTIVRRGIPVSVSKKSAEAIGENNYLLLEFKSPLAKNYLELYKKYGAIFLLGSSMGESINYFPQIEKINSISDPLKLRFKNMIDNNNDYFILQGSDPADKDSCCPNPLVSELKQLANAGLVSSYGSPTAGSCPMTIYAFNGELSTVDGGFPTFNQNGLLRLAMRKYL